jgi:B12-binding domain/radical SAM domain protein
LAINYDVLFLHPPAIYDFRKKVIFPGLMSSSVEAAQFTKVPIGLLSLAEYLDRHGYKVLVDNLGDRMVTDSELDVEAHIRNLSARIFAVGLHFQWHLPGALEIARICKKYHPGSLVIMGGLTATCFHKEILEKYEFVDAVIRGEAEKPLLKLLRAFEKHGHLTATPNLTYRTPAGEIITTPLMPASTSLEEFEFTRLDLLEPRNSIFVEGTVPRWSLEVCRGCVYSCAICGGSAYTYKTYFGMNRPAFRSPEKIIRDIHRLNEQGVYNIGLYQDPRMGGRDYTRELLTRLATEKLDIERLSLDLLVPADEGLIRQIADIKHPVTIHICPDTGCDSVRKKLGRHYSTDQLIKTVKLCHKYRIPVTSFFSIGLAGDTRQSVQETWELWDQLFSLEHLLMTKGGDSMSGSGVPLGGPITGPIMLDPGSLGYDFPNQYGYKLRFRNLEEFVQGLSLPSWHQWLNYETDTLNREALIGLLLESTAFGIELRSVCGFSPGSQADIERLRLKLDIEAVNGVNLVMTLKEPEKRELALESLKKQYDAYFNPEAPLT